MIFVFVKLVGYFWECSMFYKCDLYICWMLLTEAALFSRKRLMPSAVILLPSACSRNARERANPAKVVREQYREILASAPPWACLRLTVL